jgi:hypothetical protein
MRRLTLVVHTINHNTANHFSAWSTGIFAAQWVIGGTFVASGGTVGAFVGAGAKFRDWLKFDLLPSAEHQDQARHH